MGEAVPAQNDAATLQPPLDGRQLSKWLEIQSEETQSKLATDKLEELLANAAQPRHASGNACIKLCYFIEQCKSSGSSLLRGMAYSKSTCLSLFNFYIEWNEKNQHRSMRQVVELLSSLVDKNSNELTKTTVKTSILERSLSIITHQAAQPLVKPAFKALECLLSKRTVSTQELIDAYRHHKRSATSPMLSTDETELNAAWDSLFSEVFEWMTLADISPAAGKFLVTVFRELRNSSGQVSSANPIASWQRWICEGLQIQPGALENVKNYLFPPLFKFDRGGSLIFLEELNTQSSIWKTTNEKFDAQSLLRLAALEVGKKSGLVEEPQIVVQVSKKSSAAIVLREELLSSLLLHASGTVRTMAFSVLVSSSSSIRPFSPTALDVIKSNLRVLHCDSDAKFRNEVLSNTKHMVERLRGATALLVREIESVSFQLRPEHRISTEEREMAQQASKQTTELLQAHSDFIEWYIEFLLSELVPTASYPRHITALKAISLLLSSGVMTPSPQCPAVRKSDNATIWPCMLDFFSPMSMRLLLDLLLDPFEDVRSSATSILRLASADDFTKAGLVRELQDGNSSFQQIIPAPTLAVDSQKISAENVNVYNEGDYSGGEDVDSKILCVLKDFISRGEVCSKRTGRADYADGVARSISLLFSLLPSTEEQTKLLTDLVQDLERKLSLAEKDLAQAVHEAPVHSIFAALNFVWDSINHKELFRAGSPAPSAHTRTLWDSLQSRIVFACSRVWEIVREILCNDSPEGHLPQDLDDSEIIDTKDVLSYSFRAVHESSNLLQTLLEKIRIRWETSSKPPPPGIFSSIGDLTFLQLSTLRHRGAFSTVSLTFTKCCVLTQLEPQTEPQTFSSSLSLNRLEAWYQGALRCIREQASTTRRSAGIPALITAIMAANSQYPSFDKIMEDLEKLARRPAESITTDATEVFQVHALNSIKDIFKNTVLGKRSEKYIPRGLDLAADSLRSPRWHIRNAGLILLRSIIDRLFGTSESKAVTESGWDGKSMKLFYDAYPHLPELLNNLLEANADNSLTQPALSAVELVFPALDIIRRAGPPPSHLESIRKSVLFHLGSRAWHLREIAAHTICTMTLGTEWETTVLSLMESSTNSANVRHGILLAARYIVERRFSLDPSHILAGLATIIRILPRAASDDADRFKSEVIMLGHIELSISIAKVLIAYKPSDKVEINLLHQMAASFWARELDVHPRMSEILRWFCPNQSTFVQCRPALARLAVFVTALKRDEKALELFSQDILRFGNEVQVAALAAIPEAWGLNCSLHQRYQIYLTAARSPSAEIRTFAHNSLATTLDNCYSTASTPEKERVHQSLTNFRPNFIIFDEIHIGEDELCSDIKFAAWMALGVLNSSTMPKAQRDSFVRSDLTTWSFFLTKSSSANSNISQRLAVATALRSFYCHLNKTRLNAEDWEPQIPCLSALYDVINDDDEECRVIAAEGASSILNECLTPPAASQKLTTWLVKRFHNSPIFSRIVLYRMTGRLPPNVDVQQDYLVAPRHQFELAFREDNVLFAKEEPNLFIDQAWEIDLWSQLFLEIDPRALVDRPRRVWGGRRPDRVSILEFADWVSDALDILMGHMRLDGPLAYTSRPAGYTVVFRVLRCANVFIDYYFKHIEEFRNNADLMRELEGKAEKVTFDLEKFRHQAEETNLHPSLIQELQAQQHSRISLRWKHGSKVDGS